MDKTKDKPVEDTEAQSEYCKAARDSCKNFMLYMGNMLTVCRRCQFTGRTSNKLAVRIFVPATRDPVMLTTSAGSSHKSFKRRKFSP